jgi:hypothetical protein
LVQGDTSDILNDDASAIIVKGTNTDGNQAYWIKSEQIEKLSILDLGANVDFILHIR